MKHEIALISVPQSNKQPKLVSRDKSKAADFTRALSRVRLDVSEQAIYSATYSATYSAIFSIPPSKRCHYSAGKFFDFKFDLGIVAQRLANSDADSGIGTCFNPDNPLGRGMMARRFASRFAHSRQAHSPAYGREARARKCRKTTASARVGSKSRLMDYLGLMRAIYFAATYRS